MALISHFCEIEPSTALLDESWWESSKPCNSITFWSKNTRAYTHPYGKCLYDDNWKLSAWFPEQHCNPLHRVGLLFQLFLFLMSSKIDKQSMLAMDCRNERAPKIIHNWTGRTRELPKNKAHSSNSNYRSWVFVFRCHLDSTVVIMIEMKNGKIRKKVEISSQQIKN